MGSDAFGTLPSPVEAVAGLSEPIVHALLVGDATGLAFTKGEGCKAGLDESLFAMSYTGSEDSV